MQTVGHAVARWVYLPERDQACNPVHLDPVARTFDFAHTLSRRRDQAGRPRGFTQRVSSLVRALVLHAPPVQSQWRRRFGEMPSSRADDVRADATSHSQSSDLGPLIRTTVSSGAMIEGLEPYTDLRPSVQASTSAASALWRRSTRVRPATASSAGAPRSQTDRSSIAFDTRRDRPLGRERQQGRALFHRRVSLAYLHLE